MFSALQTNPNSFVLCVAKRNGEEKSKKILLVDHMLSGEFLYRFGKSTSACRGGQVDRFIFSLFASVNKRIQSSTARIFIVDRLVRFAQKQQPPPSLVRLLVEHRVGRHHRVLRHQEDQRYGQDGDQREEKKLGRLIDHMVLVHQQDGFVVLERESVVAAALLELAARRRVRERDQRVQ